jgi:predicted NAD/FAD-dependent oxidoreductase
MKKVAIIGAGLAGLTLAEHIADIAAVTLFDKFHQVSGRMAAREYAPFVFDHGAQFFTAKHPAFVSLMQHLVQQGVVARWDARFVEIDDAQIKASRVWDSSYPHYVGVPNMAAIGQFLYAQLLQRNMEIRLNTPVTRVEKQGEQWCLSNTDDGKLGCYDWVVSAMPAEQASRLMPACYQHQETINRIEMQPCYALMLGFEQVLDLEWDAAHITHSVLSWVSVNSTKPGRQTSTSLVAMSRNLWAAQHFNQPEHWVIDTLMQALAKVAGNQVLQPKELALKKWHFANAQKSTLKHALIDAQQQLASCGDWCISGRVESAFVSARQLGHALQHYL